MNSILDVVSQKVSASSVEEAIQKVCNWTVEEVPVFVNGEVFPKVKAFCRSDNKAVLGVVGKNTRPLQNVEAFKFFNNFLDSMTIERVGTTNNGAKVFILASMNKADRIVDDDIVNRYLLLSNSHDGTLAVRVGFTPIRVHCANMLKSAHKAGVFVSIKHNLNLTKKLDDVRKAILNNDEFDKTVEIYKFLATKKVNGDSLKAYFSGFSKEEKLLELFENDKGNGATFWHAYNAVNSYLNHSKHSDKRVESLLWGHYDKLNKLALDKAIQMANAA
ncbi:MAG: DUF932 domain-containing protein [Endomicrobiia bacterium]